MSYKNFLRFGQFCCLQCAIPATRKNFTNIQTTADFLLKMECLYVILYIIFPKMYWLPFFMLMGKKKYSEMMILNILNCYLKWMSLFYAINI